MHQNSEVTPKTSQKSQKRRKKNSPHQTAGVRLRLEFWYNDEKPPKQFSQSYFSKKNHHQVMFSGQNVRFSCFFFSKNDRKPENSGFLPQKFTKNFPSGGRHGLKN